MKKTLLLFVAAILVAQPAFAQGIGGALRRGQQAKEAKDKVDAFIFTSEERAKLGADISAKLRDRYGVVQDAKVTKYVSLVGLTVAKNSPQPDLPWQFIVLDTDGINAYAAPGGFVHITRGALGFLQNEAELAGVLGHEVGHVIGDHTIKAIQKALGAQALAGLARQEALTRVANAGYDFIVEGAFDRGDEIDADKRGVDSVGKAGYNATALTGFLTRLGERNKGNPDRNGLFASHPEMKERNDKIVSAAKGAKFTSAAVVAPRYTSNISYKPIPMASIATVAPPASAAKASDEKKGPSLGGVRNALSSGSQRNATQTTASAGARGVTPDRDAKGGPVKTAVKVSISAAELASFKTGIS